MFEHDQVVKFVEAHVMPWSVKIGVAIIIFIIGQLIAKVLSQVLGKILGRTKLDRILVEFLQSLAQALLLVVVLVAALDQLGVNTNSLIAMLGAAGLAIGLALQSSLQNFAAGFMLLIFRPFKSGDYVETAGTAGIIEKIGIFSTVLYTGDNKEVIIPNGAIYSSNIINYSARKTRRIDMLFNISYGDDLRLAKDIILKVISEEPRILKEPETQVAVGELAASSVNFIVRPWVKTEDYWDVKFVLNERIKLAFDENKITIPFPQMDLNHKGITAADLQKEKMPQ